MKTLLLVLIAALVVKWGLRFGEGLSSPRSPRLKQVPRSSMWAKPLGCGGQKEEAEPPKRVPFFATSSKVNKSQQRDRLDSTARQESAAEDPPSTIASPTQSPDYLELPASHHNGASAPSLEFPPMQSNDGSTVSKEPTIGFVEPISSTTSTDSVDGAPLKSTQTTSNEMNWTSSLEDTNAPMIDLLIFPESWTESVGDAAEISPATVRHAVESPNSSKGPAFRVSVASCNETVVADQTRRVVVNGDYGARKSNLLDGVKSGDSTTTTQWASVVKGHPVSTVSVASLANVMGKLQTRAEQEVKDGPTGNRPIYGQISIASFLQERWEQEEPKTNAVRTEAQRRGRKPPKWID